MCVYREGGEMYESVCARKVVWILQCWQFKVPLKKGTVGSRTNLMILYHFKHIGQSVSGITLKKKEHSESDEIPKSRWKLKKKKQQQQRVLTTCSMWTVNALRNSGKRAGHCRVAVRQFEVSVSLLHWHTHTHNNNNNNNNNINKQ